EKGGKRAGGLRGAFGLGHGSAHNEKNGAEWDDEDGINGLGRIRKRVTIILDKLENLPGVMAVTQLIQPPVRGGGSGRVANANGKDKKKRKDSQRKRKRESLGSGSDDGVKDTSDQPGAGHSREVTVVSPTPASATSKNGHFSMYLSVLRLLELTDRPSAVMKSSISMLLLDADPLLEVFRMFVALIGLEGRSSSSSSSSTHEPSEATGRRDSSQSSPEKPVDDVDVDIDSDHRPSIDNPTATGPSSGVVITNGIEIVPRADMAWTVGEWADREDTDLIVVPWGLKGIGGGSPSHPHHPASPTTPTPTSPPATTTTTTNPQPKSAANSLPATGRTTPIGNHPEPHRLPNPFEALFWGNQHTHHAPTSPTTITRPQHPSQLTQYSSAFIRGVFSHVGKTKDVALFVDTGRSTKNGVANVLDFGDGAGRGVVPRRQHLYLPFFGGPDDRMALEMVIQICMREGVGATIVRFIKAEGSIKAKGRKTEGDSDDDDDEEYGNKMEDLNRMTVTSAISNFGDTVYGQFTTETRMQSESADNLVWGQCLALKQHGFSAISSHSHPSSSGGAADATSTAPPPIVQPKSEWESQLLLSLARIEFKESIGLTPLKTAIEHGRLLLTEIVSQSPKSPTDTNANTGADIGTGTETAKARKDKSSKANNKRTNQPNSGDRERERRLIIVTGRSRRLAVENHDHELRGLMDEYASTTSPAHPPPPTTTTATTTTTTSPPDAASSSTSPQPQPPHGHGHGHGHGGNMSGTPLGDDVRKTLGDVASAFVVTGVGAGVLVVQAKEGGAA
ncbi:hypothetical protein BDN72DRAFT_898460, partial [Pluteus cervinus]